MVAVGFRIQKYPPTPNLSKIKPISWQICKFLHFSVLRHIHNKRLPWQHLRLMRIVIMCKMTPISVRLNWKNFILISCAVLELLRKVSQGGGIRPPRWDRVKVHSLKLKSSEISFCAIWHAPWFFVNHGELKFGDLTFYSIRGSNNSIQRTFSVTGQLLNSVFSAYYRS